MSKEGIIITDNGRRLFIVNQNTGQFVNNEPARPDTSGPRGRTTNGDRQNDNPHGDGRSPRIIYQRGR